MMNDKIAIELADLWENESIDAKPAGRAEALRECADALRMMASATLPGQRVIDTTLHPERAPTHRCKICGAFWMRWSENWSLCSKSCGECCDNAAMGDQIVPLIISDIFTPSTVLAHIEQLRADHGSVTILCDDEDASTVSEQMAVECCDDWTSWEPKRFYGETVADCLAKAAQAMGEGRGATDHPPKRGAEQVSETDLLARLEALAGLVTPEIKAGTVSVKAMESLLRAGREGMRPRPRNDPHYEADAELFTTLANNLPATCMSIPRSRPNHAPTPPAKEAPND